MGPARKRLWNKPIWDGAPLEGRTILLLHEQGLGDTLQFIRYAPLVQKRGAKIVISCPPRWVGILKTCAGLDMSGVSFLDESQPPPSIDVQAALLTLPGIFKTDLNSIPAEVPYLAADEALVRSWRERLGSSAEFRVGNHWQGNPKYRGDRARSIPLAHFAPLAKIAGVRLVSLQKGDGLEQLSGANFPVEDLSKSLDLEATMVDTAAVIKNLDLVISSDTAVVHLAGALAAPTWVALPLAPDWRWLLARSDSPWYPTMRLFRQATRGDWAEVFERVAAALQEVVAAKNKKQPGKSRDSSSFID
jgi:hypothetical protein